MAIEHDEPEAPRKEYGFKEREFKRENAAPSGQPAMPTAKELAMMASPTTAKPPGAASGGANRATDPNDVYAVLQHNRTKEKQFGLNEVQLKEIKSRRRRDYWLMMLTINPALIAFAYVGRHNFFVLVSSLAGVIVVSIGLTWIMWQVMNKY